MEESAPALPVGQFDVATAIAYAQAGKLEEWIHSYLTTGAWANPGLSDGLKRQRRWWNGPLEISVAQLVRAVGPEPEREYVVNEAYWLQRTEELAATLTNPQELPPLIAEYRQGELSIRDGNHRLGAIERLGWHACWVVIWYNSAQEYVEHSQHLVE